MADTNKRDTDSLSGWINELGLLAVHRDAGMPAWIRSAIRTIYAGLHKHNAKAAPVPAQPAEVPEAVKAAIREYLEASDATRQSQGTWAHPRQWKYNDPEMARLRTARSALGALLSAADSRSPDKCQCNAEGEVTDACKDCPR